MSVIQWFKNKMLVISLALARVERNALSSEGNMMSDDTDQVQRHKQGMLSDDLMQGRITEEVKLLRHRMYKILDESSKIKAKFRKDSEGNITYELIDRSIIGSKVKGDPFDDYKVELVVDNTPTTEGFGLENDSEHPDDAKVNNQIICGRDGVIPKFKLEQYCAKLYVRYIADNDRLLEFHLPMYVDQYNRRTRLLISEIKKLIEHPELSARVSDILDIKTVTFITFNTLGAQDFREFHYDINKFDKIVEYDGSYIIKFKAQVVINGDNIIDKYRHEEQEKRYENKERRK